MDRPFRLIEELEVAEAGHVASQDAQPGFVVLDPAGDELTPATDWLLQLLARDCSPHTQRAYAMSLLRFLRFLWTLDVPWERATELEVRDFVLWARQAPKFIGNKRARDGGQSRVNRVTGKQYQGSKYSPKTINHTLTAVREFYTFQESRGLGPIVNPVPGDDRRHRGHNPEEDFIRHRRAPLRQREPDREPKSLPDAQFDQLLRRLGSNRDRALVAFYVSSGARATELLSLTGEMVNYGDQLIGVIRKGGALQWLPASPDAFVWLRLYQVERGTAGTNEPVWLTLREPRRQLTYAALRAVLNRVNALLGSNWSSHDLRHTFAIRALEGGVPLHEVQELLGHVSLATTSIYSKPRMEDVIAHHRAALSKKPIHDEQVPLGYDAAELDSLWEGRT